jgi:hypothetical protein
MNTQQPMTTHETQGQLPLSDDTLDYVDSQMEKLTDTENLAEKICIHQQLKDTIKKLENEINDLAERIDKIDTDTFKELGSMGQMSDGDPDDGLANIEQIVNDLPNEETMQQKVAQFERLANIVKSCKMKCIASEVKMRKCN